MIGRKTMRNFCWPIVVRPPDNLYYNGYFRGFLSVDTTLMRLQKSSSNNIRPTTTVKSSTTLRMRHKKNLAVNLRLNLVHTIIQTKNLAVNLRLNLVHTIIQTKNLAVNLRLNRGPSKI